MYNDARRGHGCNKLDALLAQIQNKQQNNKTHLRIFTLVHHDEALKERSSIRATPLADCYVPDLDETCMYGQPNLDLLLPLSVVATTSSVT